MFGSFKERFIFYALEWTTGGYKINGECIILFPIDIIQPYINILVPHTNSHRISYPVHDQVWRDSLTIPNDHERLDYQENDGNAIAITQEGALSTMLSFSFLATILTTCWYFYCFKIDIVWQWTRWSQLLALTEGGGSGTFYWKHQHTCEQCYKCNINSRIYSINTPAITAITDNFLLLYQTWSEEKVYKEKSGFQIIWVYVVWIRDDGWWMMNDGVSK